MNMAKKVLRAVDGYQQKHVWLAFPVAVWKKFGDDHAGNLAMLVAWFAFVSIFPLMLVLVTVLDIVLKNNPDLQHRLLNSALSQYPLLGQQLGHISRINQSGLPLVIGLVGTFLGAWAWPTRCRTRSTRRGRSRTRAVPAFPGRGCAAWGRSS